jgi:ABC-type sugar transport system ATPase subunit
VTHDQVEAMTMASRIVVMRQGVIQQIGTPVEVYAEPANKFVATFVGSPPMNLFDGHFANANDMPVFSGNITVSLDGRWNGFAMPDEATLGVRPEDIQVARPDDPNVLLGRIELVEKVGAEEYLSDALDGGASCTVRASIRVAAREGERIALQFPPDAIHLFTADGLRLRTA